MRNIIRGSLLIAAATLLSACGSNTGSSSNVLSRGVMQSGGVNVLKTSPAPDIKVDSKEGSLFFNAPKYQVECWLLPNAKTVDDGIGQAGAAITSEFKNFKETTTTDLTVAGSPAKRVVGTGNEADDNDEGSADLIVFKVGDHVFVACTHGEKLDPLGQAGMLEIVQTAQVP